MNKIGLFIFIIILLTYTSGCTNTNQSMHLNKVGLLLEDTIDDKGWNSKGYQGLLKIQSDLDVDVFFKEEIDTLNKVKMAVEELANKEVNLIFGHGRVFAKHFSDIHTQYPHIHFVSFNGEVEGENMTSLHFKSDAMGFFGGMVAAKMSQTNKIGVIAAYSWQPEVEGFVKGAKYQDSDVLVRVEYVKDWTDVDKALDYMVEMKNNGIDVFYPAGDGYHIPVIEEVKESGLFAIGFVGDQSDLGESTVLTSTVQHVDILYKIVAERFNNRELEPGNVYYDFVDGVVTLGSFSSVVPEDFQNDIDAAIKQYIQTSKLPNE